MNENRCTLIVTAAHGAIMGRSIISITITPELLNSTNTDDLVKMFGVPCMHVIFESLKEKYKSENPPTKIRYKDLKDAGIIL